MPPSPRPPDAPTPDQSSPRSWRKALLVVAALACLATGILVPRVLRARAQGHLTQCRLNLMKLGTALEMYSTDNGGKFPRVLRKLTPAYLLEVPACPRVAADTYSTGYSSASNPDAYTVVCRGEGHAPLQPANFPQYKSTGNACMSRSR